MQLDVAFPEPCAATGHEHRRFLDLDHAEYVDEERTGRALLDPRHRQLHVVESIEGHGHTILPRTCVVRRARRSFSGVSQALRRDCRRSTIVRYARQRNLLHTMTAVKRLWPLACFVALAYAISWGWTFPLVAAGEVVKTGVGWPTSVPAFAGPVLAALVVTALVWGRAGLRDLLARVARWRMPLRWWAAALSPLAFLGVALLVALAANKLPRASDFGRYSGLPAVGVVVVWVIVILLSFGEETGWRGFALPLLQRRCAARHSDLGRLAPTVLLYCRRVSQLPPCRLRRFRLQPRLRLDRAHLALQRHRR